jgi:Lrp/AsnC family transcriptional regulator, leucine-responsive regulatory protein
MSTRRNGTALDRIDEHLVALLRQDARRSVTELAKAVCLSRTAVQARIGRLEREEIIVGYRAVLGEGGVDDGLGAILSITFSRRPCTPVVEQFRRWPEIRQIYSVTGPIDAYVIVRVTGASALNDLVHRLSAIPGVGSVSSAVMLKAD